MRKSKSGAELRGYALGLKLAWGYRKLSKALRRLSKAFVRLLEGVIIWVVASILVIVGFYWGWNLAELFFSL